jgi:hypothetical protein
MKETENAPVAACSLTFVAATARIRPDYLFPPDGGKGGGAGVQVFACIYVIIRIPGEGVHSSEHSARRSGGD